MNKQVRVTGKKNAKAASSKGIEDVQHNSVFGRYSEGEMIARLKRLALDPDREQFESDDIQPLMNQILRIRKIMLLKDSEIPWKKRKLEQFIKKDALIAPSALVLPNQQSIAKLSRRQLSHASSLSCLLNSVDSTQCLESKLIFHSHTSSTSSAFDDLSEKDASDDCSFLDNTEFLNFPHKDTSRIVYSDKSINGSNLLSPEKPIVNEVRQLPPHRRSPRLLNSIEDHLQTSVVPVGPRFQADVPEWRNILIGAYKSDSDNSKWLGSKVWPIEIEIENMKTNKRKIGKGRLDSCGCLSKGSADCIRQHIHEERLILERDLGPAFFAWKFNEMGEQVSNSWSHKERKTFESLVKKRPSSNGKSFVKQALKCLPNKHSKDIIDYYFNVHIPHRMSIQTRSLSIEQIDTDNEDGAENFNYMGFQKKSRGICNGKDAKGRYLRGV
ncbi:hypothetical protein ABFX02_10G022300 [Erythranthe guttata]